MSRWYLMCFLIIYCEANTLPVQKKLGVSRIIGGSDAIPGQFPYQASLRKVANRRHFCGGSIVTNHWILTAAHCTIEERPSTIFAIIGTHLLSGAGGVEHAIDIIRNHERFYIETIENDVAVIRTEIEMEFSLFVSAIPLINRKVENEALIVSGWGRTSAADLQHPQNLKWLRTFGMKSEDCSRLVDMNEDTFCAYRKFEKLSKAVQTPDSL